ncbi:unnamed protein product [Adineta steineri]|uniref:BPTI/Kunitz inhibitor domain-containing protein n=1 Tax=Adineta steineri TaxID=433720 RepID=A0A818MD61_9BILA|nr:unnamed protein product [Adineta steineri]
MIHWSHTASLYFPSENHENLSIINNEYLQSESFNSQIPLIKRLRRWTINGDNDEVEIPFNESHLSINNSSSIDNSTLVNFVTIESNTSNIEYVNDLNLTTTEIKSDENTMIKYPLSEPDLNQTITSSTEEVLQNNNNTSLSPLISNELTSINTEILTTNVTQMITTDHVFNTFESSSPSVSILPTQTTHEIESVTTIIHSDSTTAYPDATVINQTNEWNSVFNEKIEIISLNDSSTINSNISLKDARITIDQQIFTNDTDIVMFDNLDESLKVSTMPICDASCLCSKECLYGFELLNDTCLCNPPCTNYQCFGTDTCIITDEGHPLCQPQNGTEYDRPNRCYQPRDAGYHDIDIRYHNRWYYHPDQDTCHLFVYRGLGGNENNFQTLDECHSECITCAPSPDPGDCFGHVNMWYYDNKKGECREFEYSGCKGNDNKFFKKELCIDTCITRRPFLK